MRSKWFFLSILFLAFSLFAQAQVGSGSLCFPVLETRGEFNGVAIRLPRTFDFRPGGQDDITAAEAVVAAGGIITKASANVLVGATQTIVLDAMGVDAFYIQWRRDLDLGSADLSYAVFASIPATTAVPDPTDMKQITLTQKTGGTSTPMEASDGNIYYGETLGASNLIIVATVVAGSTGSIAWSPAAN